jgi:hypothetical protein
MATLFGDRAKSLSDWVDANPGARERFSARWGAGRTVTQYASAHAHIEDILERISTEVGAPRTVIYPQLSA